MADDARLAELRGLLAEALNDAWRQQIALAAKPWLPSINDRFRLADALLSGPLAGLLAADTARAQAEAKVARVRAALDVAEMYVQEITDNLRGIPKADYGPSEWRLVGDARGHRMTVAEIRDALDGQR